VNRRQLNWPAPTDLRHGGTYACLDFVNSEWTDWRGKETPTDRLGTPQWSRRFLTRWGMTSAGLAAPGATRLAELRTLRRLMRSVLQTGRRPTRRELAWLDGRLARSPQRWVIGAAGPGLSYAVVPARPGWPAVIATLILSFGQLVNEADRSRIKKCANPDCSYLFFDVSTNRSRRWCFSNVCGNLTHVRDFRARSN
jgi:predicted RNA-binding Zn ribbon-like protein